MIDRTDGPKISQPSNAVAPPKKVSIWGRMGGAALAIAILLHIGLLVVGAIWVLKIIQPLEKTVDFMPGNGEAGGGERGAQHKIQQKRRAQITPSTSVKRVFADGAVSNYAIPEQGDEFSQISALSSMGGGGLSGGLGGSGGGKGFGSGMGEGTGGMRAAGATLFGLQMENTKKVAVVMDVSRSMTNYLPIVAKELDKLSSRGPLILYFGCGLRPEPKQRSINDKVYLANGKIFDRFWQNWQGNAPLNIKPEEQKKLTYDPNVAMPLAAIHEQMSKRLDTYFIDFNGIQYAQTALLCKEVKDADTIYWFADFEDMVDDEVMKDVLRQLKSRKQKLYLHATKVGKSFNAVRNKLCEPSGGKAIVKDLKKGRK
ncbi:MAG: hypothetical protein RLZ22_189 [Verrucomicrobiota bacterium]|jgi:hypothetical protein